MSHPPYVTTHLLSIERANWPKVHDMFKACDAKTWQHELPVGFQVRVCALNLLFINIFNDVFVCIESSCVIKAKHVLLAWEFVRFCTGKTALVLKCSCNFSHIKSNESTEQQDVFYYKIVCPQCRFSFPLLVKRPRGRFKDSYQLLNLRAKSSQSFNFV